MARDAGPAARRTGPAAACGGYGRGTGCWLAAAPLPRIPLRLERVCRSGPLLAELAGRLAEPGPVPVQGVAMVSHLLADGTGPLYRAACLDDLDAIIERAAHALTC